LQDLIDKVLFPDVAAEDATLEREFYAQRNIPLKQQKHAAKISNKKKKTRGQQPTR
jgi:hypothetical protein